MAGAVRPPAQTRRALAGNHQAVGSERRDRLTHHRATDACGQREFLLGRQASARLQASLESQRRAARQFLGPIDTGPSASEIVLAFFTGFADQFPRDNNYTNRTRRKSKCRLFSRRQRHNLFPTFYSNNPPVRRPAAPTFGAGHVDRAAALVEHIRYKVIIQIRLSVPRFRYMLPNGRVCCLPPIDMAKGAKYVLDDASYRGSVHRHGGHQLPVGRTLTGSSATSDCNVGVYPRVCRESCGRLWIFLMERPLSSSLTARHDRLGLTKMSIRLDGQRPSARLSQARRLICFSETWRRRPFKAVQRYEAIRSAAGRGRAHSRSVYWLGAPRLGQTRGDWFIHRPNC